MPGKEYASIQRAVGKIIKKLKSLTTINDEKIHKDAIRELYKWKYEILYQEGKIPAAMETINELIMQSISEHSEKA